MIIENDIVTAEGHRHELLNGTVVNRYSHVVKGAEIGNNCMIGQCCYIASNVKIGFAVRIQNRNDIFDGCRIGNEVFIGPNCTITNHHDPRNLKNDPHYPHSVQIGDNTTICAGVTIIAPCKIGKGCMIAAGALVLRDIQDGEFVKGTVK